MNFDERRLTSRESVRVLLSTDPEASRLVGDGWSVSARSFGARLFVDVDVDRASAHIRRLSGLVVRAQDRGFTIVELDPRWVARVAAFDAATAPDYPSDSPATRRTPLTPSELDSLWLEEGTIAIGALAGADLVGVTVMYPVAEGVVETEFTAVAAAARGKGVGSALKAWSIVSAVERGVTEFRTGGAVSNAAIRRSNAEVGYVETEEWWTLRHA